ncbi:aminotransferase class I/II-fold pyridoxal phosphate-dependent enzyme [Clostridium estertheticum]|uniref:aminotransferase class I/II-fold pyridoxal phosphate-dependent enzyme n=1 Tax=Clostridium estertheticum TaxID=238834 RepID=UPI0035CC3C4D
MSVAESIFVSLRPPCFDFNVLELEAAFKQNPKALILFNSSNPTEKAFTFEDIKTIADLSEKYDVFVITDEVY